MKHINEIKSLDEFIELFHDTKITKFNIDEIILIFKFIQNNQSNEEFDPEYFENYVLSFSSAKDAFNAVSEEVQDYYNEVDEFVKHYHKLITNGKHYILFL